MANNAAQCAKELNVICIKQFLFQYITSNVINNKNEL